MAILALDQGTTSCRSIVYSLAGEVMGQAQHEFHQYFPQLGWVEHDAQEIVDTQLATARQAVQAAGLSIGAIRAVGITNQRETVVLWDRQTGLPVQRAIVWQDRRTNDRCQQLRADGHEHLIRKHSGLVLDPYFSATKLAWLLDQDPALRQRAESGELAAGTIDSWLIWQLTGGAHHITDVSNASRTSLMDLATCSWSDELCHIFNVPKSILPQIVDSAGPLAEGKLDGQPMPIRAIIGDQQAALFGQACISAGMAKNTYGTGAFAMVNTGAAITFHDGALTTVAWRMPNKPTTYAVEGSVLVAGSAVQWLRDGLGVVIDASESEALARSVADSGGVMVVPALAGLGTPHWDAEVRGTILGVTRGTTRGHLMRATLDGIAHSVCDAIHALCGGSPQVLRVDGGMCANNFLLEHQANLLGCAVERPSDIETTARGAAMLAACGAGLLNDTNLTSWWQSDCRFEPTMPPSERSQARARWQRAITTARSWTSCD